MKKKKKKKKKGTAQPAVQQERHRDQPLMFELGSVFDALTTSPRSQQVGRPGSVPIYTIISIPTTLGKETQ